MLKKFGTLGIASESIRLLKGGEPSLLLCILFPQGTVCSLRPNFRIYHVEPSTVPPLALYARRVYLHLFSLSPLLIRVNEAMIAFLGIISFELWHSIGVYQPLMRKFQPSLAPLLKLTVGI